MDLLSSYSNRLDIAADLAVSLHKLVQATKDERPAGCKSVRSEQPPTVWRVADRMTDEDVHQLIARYIDGTTARMLATEFKIGLTNVKRLIREHGARRKDNRARAGSG